MFVVVEPHGGRALCHEEAKQTQGRGVADTSTFCVNEGDQTLALKIGRGEVQPRTIFAGVTAFVADGQEFTTNAPGVLA